MTILETNSPPDNVTNSGYKLLLKIWIKPRETMRFIINTNPKQFVIILAMLNGVLEVLSKASEKNLGDTLSLKNIYLTGIIAGPIAGMIGLYFFGSLLKWTGSWIGGKASYEEILAAYAWGLAPMVTVGLLLLIPELILFGKGMYTSELTTISSNSYLLVLLLIQAFIQIVSGIWSLVVFFINLSEVQGFSVWKSIGNSLLTGTILLIPIILIVILFI